MFFSIFFFFSSRRRHTRCGRDWSSDVCSSDLRWQIMLRDGSTLWDLRLVKVSGDTLVFQGNDSTLRFPLMHVDELRLVRKATRSIAPEAGRYRGVLDRRDDQGLPPSPFAP